MVSPYRSTAFLLNFYSIILQNLPFICTVFMYVRFSVCVCVRARAVL
uniref:Uncharacterized protein n=1 Tax=Rhizophora mucronata TaxID=61149 RepID=A0A2P2IZC4_RHIMU